ncbi:MAG TPA: hypothetical protein VHV75_19285 [Solirubrobacteraceae bacterium]|jgi:hypothetical protein|nr:hypothetical protein [Solirubrobacteraceae bacterium]
MIAEPFSVTIITATVNGYALHERQAVRITVDETGPRLWLLELDPREQDIEWHTLRQLAGNSTIEGTVEHGQPNGGQRAVYTDRTVTFNAEAAV